MSSEADRRHIEDRRLDELGPPEGWRDRRRSVERRMISVGEVGYEEWAAAQEEHAAHADVLDEENVFSYDSPR